MSIPSINVNINKQVKELSPQRKKELEEATRRKRKNKLKLLFNSSILISCTEPGLYTEYIEGVSKMPPIGIMVFSIKNTGLVLDFTDPRHVKLYDVEARIDNVVYRQLKEATFVYNKRNKPLIRRRFLIKQSNNEERIKVPIDFLISELLALGWLSFLINTGNTTPDTKEQLRAVVKWSTNRNLTIITSNKAEPFSLYGLSVARRKG